MTFEHSIKGPRSTPLPLTGRDLYLQYEAHYKTMRAASGTQTIATKFFALGGVGEVGKNTYVIEHDNEIIVIDAGIKFLDRRKFPGMTGIIAPLEYIKANQDRLKALIITHGHEDHIGGVPYWARELKVPQIITPVIASELIKRKLGEHKLQANMALYSDKCAFKTEHFLIDFFRVNHSVPDSFGVSIMTPNGLIVSSGDFRFDCCSPWDKFDLNKASMISKRGIDLLLCESTNSEQPRFNESEHIVINEIANIIFSTKNRVFITSFASNLGRIEEVIKIAHAAKRKILILGRSIDSNIEAAKRAGYIKISDTNFISVREIDRYNDSEILVLCTGSQGEENASLNTLVRGTNSMIQIKSSDTIIFSSNIIPGNSIPVNEVINKLYKTGARIYLNSEKHKVHSSGHATKQEQQLFICLMNPAHIVPIHGEYRMIRALKRNCVEVGVPEKNITLVKNGEIIELLNGKVTKAEKSFEDVPLYIDDGQLTDNLDSLKRRVEMSERGVLFFQFFVDTKKKKIVASPQLSSMGAFHFMESAEDLKVIVNKTNIYLKELVREGDRLLEEKVGKFITKETLLITKTTPMVRVIVNEIDSSDMQKHWVKPR